jgi:hypothetical protein
LTSFEAIGGVHVDVFQGLPSNSVTLCLTSWENLKKSAKTCLLEMNVKKESENHSQNNSKDFVIMLEETCTKVSIPTVR